MTLTLSTSDAETVNRNIDFGEYIVGEGARVRPQAPLRAPGPARHAREATTPRPPHLRLCPQEGSGLRVTKLKSICGRLHAPPLLPQRLFALHACSDLLKVVEVFKVLKAPLRAPRTARNPRKATTPRSPHLRLYRGASTIRKRSPSSHKKTGVPRP